MAMEHIGEALGRFNKGLSEHNEPEGDEKGEKPETKSSAKGHVHTVHAHKDGSFHHNVHHGGELVHHSEHPTMDEAAESMKSYGSGTE
jgi:hypothetical protein